ncbi:MAG TPA: SpoIIE family protein phosphatase [Terriglobales bacterium]|nr:SpoIIE family protein phosphatase [Terriglobales bacterium]
MGTSVSRVVSDDFRPRLDRRDPYLRVLCANIYVRDWDRSLRFYVDQLGFGLVVDKSYESGDRWIAVTPPDGSTILALSSPKPKTKEYKRIGQSKEVVFVTEDVVAKFHEWAQRGVRFHHPPQTTLWGGVFTRFDDPDGNSFALVGGDDFVREIETQRRAAEEKLEAERRMAQELEIAKQVQSRLFPQSIPPAKTLDYDGLCVQARSVGGDYYDFLNLGRDRLGIIIGDISGKGIAAALLMANFQANLRSQSAVAADQPERFLQSVNQLFYSNSVDSSYATVFFAEYDDTACRLRYANCGHYSALLLRFDNSLERLDSTCTVLGLFPQWTCSIAERRLSSGDVLVLYTDGVTESVNEAGEEFGEYRLLETIKRKRELDARSIIHATVNEVRKFSPHEQQDDITLIVAKCRG